MRARPIRVRLAVAVALSLLGGASQLAHATATPLTQSFRSAPSLRPPQVRMSGVDPDPGAGAILLDAQNSIQAGPLILSPRGQLVWFDPLPNGGVARNVEVQRYRGHTVLTFWRGYGHAFGVGQDVVLDHRYRPIAIVRAGNGYTADTHAFQITPQGTALIAAYAAVAANLATIGGPRNGTLIDSAVQEIDIATGRVLWQWDARAHIPLSDSYAGRPGRGAYDAYHLNSVQQLANGEVLISLRNTWALYVIDKRTGAIRWTLGGKHSSFRIGPGARFEWQHDATMLPDGTITVFDDGAALTSHGLIRDEPQSRALRIRLNFRARRATLVRAFTNDPPLLAQSQGSVQVLPDGNTFVGWGSEPYLTEFSADGRQLFTISLPAPLQSYRAFRFSWWGLPTSPPALALAPIRHGTRVYASWNGATGVVAWRVLAGGADQASSLAPVGQFAKTSFETTMALASVGPYFAVQALGRGGRVLATSAIARR